MTQSRLASAVETITGTAVGFLLSMLVLAGINLAWDLDLKLIDNVAITAIFTVVSLLRSYGIRRFFNWWHHRQPEVAIEEPRKLYAIQRPDGRVILSETPAPDYTSQLIRETLDESNTVRPIQTRTPN